MRDKRQSERVPFDRAVWILTKDLPIEAQAADVSRTGVLMQLPVDRLGRAPLNSLTEIAGHLQKVLGATCRVHMECLEHGHSVSRDVRLVRIVTDAAVQNVQLAGAFDRDLDRGEVASLGIELPDVPEESAADAGAEQEAGEPSPYEAMWQESLPFEAMAAEHATQRTPVEQIDTNSWQWRRPRTQRQRWRVFLTAADPAQGAPVRGQLHGVNTRAICMNLPQASFWDAALLDGDATAIALAVTARFGDEVAVKLTDGPKHVWSGHARVHGVELPSHQGAGLLITLTFRRPLPSAELGRMDLS